MVSGLLRMLGLNTISFTADLSPPDRGRLLGNFNDPDCHVNALVVPSTMTLSGMNMHQACNWGIMLGLDESSAKAKQAFGRLSRIGQKKEVHWSVIIMRDSHMRAQERACHTKEMHTVSVMSGIPTDVATDLLTMMCFEVARETYGAPMSTYTVSKHHEAMTSASSYEEPWVARFSTFYTMLATLGLRSLAPTGNAVRDKARVIKLCRRMQELAPLLPIVCLLMEVEGEGDPNNVLEFCLECEWNDISRYIKEAEDSVAAEKNDKDAAMRKHALELARITSGRGPDASVDDPTVKDHYNQAMAIKDIHFNPPAVPKVQPDEPSMGEQSEEPKRHQGSYDREEWSGMEDARDPEGLYEAIGAKLTDSTQELFIKYCATRRGLGFEDDLDTDDEKSTHRKELARLDLIASILCSTT